MNIDIDSLLQPIPGENPVGEWLRYDATYDRIQDARREDDDTLPQGVWQKKAKRADWRAVETLCQDALRTRTKDLQLAAYLTEAWMQLHGPVGATHGVRLLAELSRRFWDVAYPLLDGEDCSYRVAPFEWLEGRLPVLLRLLPLYPLTATGGTGPATVKAGAGASSAGGGSATVRRAVCFADWERSVRMGQPASTSTSVDNSDPDTWNGDKIASVLDRVDAVALRATASQLSDLLAATEATSLAVDQRAGRSLGALLKVSELLSRMLGFLKPWTGTMEPTGGATGVESEGARAASPGEGDASDAGERSDRQQGRIRSRAAAYKALDEIADYLLRTEPHSPTGYLVKRAVRWGELPLQQLLTELVPDERGLTAIYTLLGLAKRADGK